jgi:F420-dependent oxidoreductase-like protein
VFERLVQAARLAQEAGFDAISVPDHVHQNNIGGGPASPMFEAYTLLGALAAATSRVKLLSLVSPVTMRTPGLLAKAVTTLDVISGGRAVLGVGAGWDVDEHLAYGIDFPSLGERFDRLDEELAICRSLFTADQTKFDGNFYALTDAHNSPRPVGGSIPILVAGGGEKRTLDLVARYGDACNVSGDPDTVRRKFDVLTAHCERIGRDPAEITKTVFVFDTSDTDVLDKSAKAYAAAGADGIIVVAPEDPTKIPQIAMVIRRAFNDAPKMV